MLLYVVLFLVLYSLCGWSPEWWNKRWKLDTNHVCVEKSILWLFLLPHNPSSSSLLSWSDTHLLLSPGLRPVLCSSAPGQRMFDVFIPKLWLWAGRRSHGSFGGHSHLNLKMFLQPMKTFSCSVAFCADTAVLSIGVTGVLLRVNIPQNVLQNCWGCTKEQIRTSCTSGCY